MITNRRLKKTLWSTLTFYKGLPYLMRVTRTRKRYRHWYRQYCRANENAWNNLAPITVRPDPAMQRLSILAHGGIPA
jgi:hypothetical protein